MLLDRVRNTVAKYNKALGKYVVEQRESFRFTSHKGEQKSPWFDSFKETVVWLANK